MNEKWYVEVWGGISNQPYEEDWRYVTILAGGVLAASDANPDAPEKYFAPGRWLSAIKR